MLFSMLSEITAVLLLNGVVALLLHTTQLTQIDQVLQLMTQVLLNVGVYKQQAIFI